MSDIVERVARAMFAHDSEDVTPAFRVTWEGSLQLVRDVYLRRASAAIAAMRNPPAEMLFAGMRAAVIEGGECRTAFNAMIDEALK